MKNGLATWHYPHRSILENVAFFADHGFESVSLLGYHMDRVCSVDEQAEELARLVREKNVVLTVHHKLPADHSEQNVAQFQTAMDRIGAWQERHGSLAVLSFDVSSGIRDNVAPYVDYVLRAVPRSKVALEDFGLTPAERAQIEYLKSEERFGYLLDIGHMYIRLRGENRGSGVIFTNHPDECPADPCPTREDFLRAFRSKEFPVFEIHLHNNDGFADRHFFLEDGTLDVSIIADVLREIGFNGILTIESAPGFTFKCVYPESDERILKTYELWKKCIGK